jgi:hypothetical protein
MYVISLYGRPAAYATANDILIAAWVRGLDDYVASRWVICQAVFAQEVAAGWRSGPFTAERASRFAREALMPDAEFDRVAGQPDYLVAGHFDVPVEQVEKKHEDRGIAARSER